MWSTLTKFYHTKETTQNFTENIFWLNIPGKGDRKSDLFVRYVEWSLTFQISAFLVGGVDIGRKLNPTYTLGDSDKCYHLPSHLKWYTIWNSSRYFKVSLYIYAYFGVVYKWLCDVALVGWSRVGCVGLGWFSRFFAPFKSSMTDPCNDLRFVPPPISLKDDP